MEVATVVAMSETRPSVPIQNIFLTSHRSLRRGLASLIDFANLGFSCKSFHFTRIQAHLQITISVAGIGIPVFHRESDWSPRFSVKRNLVTVVEISADKLRLFHLTISGLFPFLQRYNIFGRDTALSGLIPQEQRHLRRISPSRFPQRQKPSRRS